MSLIIPVLLALLATTVASVSLLSGVTQTLDPVTSAVATVTNPVDQAAVGVLFSQCTAVRQLLGQGSNQTSPPDLSKLTLNLYTRETHVIFNLSTAAEEIPNSPYFKNQSKMIIYMHGFLNSPSSESVQVVNDAFLQQGDYNLLALDSSSLVGLTTLYIGAIKNVQYIGEKLGAVMANMTKVGTSASSMYLVGHSLGSHIASFAGKTFTALTGQLVGRITGLDPAGPCYTDVGTDLKLKSTDADFVDVMHTDAGVFGLNEQIGHVDFYPNGGSVQPSCSDVLCDDADDTLQGNCVTDVCAHNRAWMLFAETVVSSTMPAVACDSWDQFQDSQCNTTNISEMGFNCDPNTRGRYYLQTGGSIPYGRGSEGLAYHQDSALSI